MRWFKDRGKPPTARIDMVRDVLPAGVRSALSRDGARIDVADIRELMLPERGQQRFGFYAALKMADADPDLQLQLLEKLRLSSYSMDSLDKSTYEEQFKQFQPVAGVDVKKLGEISRKGFSHWVATYTEGYDRLTGDYHNGAVLAYSGVIALDAVMKIKDETMILLPPRDGRGVVGFKCSSDHVGPIYSYSDFAGVPIIDDIENTGATRKKVESFIPDSLYMPVVRAKVQSGIGFASVGAS